MLTPLFRSQLHDTTLDLRPVVSKVRGFIYIHAPVGVFSNLEIFVQTGQQHDIWLHDCMLICVESVLDNTTNSRILQKGSKTEQFSCWHEYIYRDHVQW